MRSMASFKDLPVGTRLFRAAGLGVLTISFVYSAYLVITVALRKTISGQAVEGTDLIILMVSLILTTLACLVMTADAWDFWMHERSYSINDVRKVQLAVTIVLGLALAMSALVVKWALFMTIAPAIIIYLFLVVRPTNEAAVKELKESEKQRKAAKRRGQGTAGHASQPAAARQRRGGRKRR